MTVQQIADRIRKLPDGSRILVLGPLIKDRKTEGERVFAAARRQGFVRVRVDGELMDLDEAPTLDKYKRHSIEVVVDRLVVRHDDADGNAFGAGQPRPGRRAPGRLGRDRAATGGGGHARGAGRRRRLRGAALQREVQLRLRRHHHRRAGAALVLVQLAARRLPRLHRPGHPPRVRRRPHHPRPHPSRSRTAPWCPGGRCPPSCRGASRRPRPSWTPTAGTTTRRRATCPPEALEYLLFAQKSEKVEVRYRHERGENSYVATFEGVVTNLERRYRETESDYIRTELEKYMVERHCPTCDGKRLKPEALGVTIDDRNISDVAAMSVSDALAWVAALPAVLSEREMAIARMVNKEIGERLGFLADVGLDYLTIDRTSSDALRRRGAAHPPGDADRLEPRGRALHPRRAHHRPAPEGQRQAHRHARCGCATSATRSSSSSTTRRPSGWPTGSWTSDRRPASTAARSSPAARSTEVLKEKRSVTGAFLRGERAVPVPEPASRGQRQGAAACGARASTTSRTSTCASRWAPSRP